MAVAMRNGRCELAKDNLDESRSVHIGRRCGFPDEGWRLECSPNFAVRRVCKCCQKGFRISESKSTGVCGVGIPRSVVQPLVLRRGKCWRWTDGVCVRDTFRLLLASLSRVALGPTVSLSLSNV